jgi:hypothetical protein
VKTSLNLGHKSDRRITKLTKPEDPLRACRGKKERRLANLLAIKNHNAMQFQIFTVALQPFLKHKANMEDF